MWTVARACPQMFFLHVRRLFRWSDSDMTYLSHIIVFAGDLINLRCVFKSSVSSRSCHKPYISVLFWANEAILLYQLSETKPKQRKMLQAQVTRLARKKMNDSECGSQWFPYAQAWQCWPPESCRINMIETLFYPREYNKCNAKTLGWREVQYV